MNRLQKDAQEFGLHVRQGGWRLGLLVARNVEPRAGQGTSFRSKRSGPKVSAAEFAREAQTTAARVLRFLAAWERAAEAGVVAPAAELRPGDDPKLDVEKLPPWEDFYDATGAGGGPGPALIERMSPQRKAALAKSLLADRDVAETALSDQRTFSHVEIAAGRVREAQQGQWQSERKARNSEKPRVTQAEYDQRAIYRLEMVAGEITRAWEHFARVWAEVFPTLSGDTKELAWSILDEVGRDGEAGAIEEALRGENVDAAIEKILGGKS